MELEPDAVARVDARFVDPVMLSAPRQTQSRFKTGVVTAESGQHCGEPIDQRCERSTESSEFGQDAFISHRIGVIVGSETISRYGGKLPVGAGAQQAGIERQETAMHGLDHPLGVGGTAFACKLAFILDTAVIGERPSTKVREGHLIRPAFSFGFSEKLLRFVLGCAGTVGDLASSGKTKQPSGVQDS